MNASILEDSTFEQVYTIVLAIIFIPLISFGVIWFIIKKKNEVKKIKTNDSKMKMNKYVKYLTQKI